MRLVNSPNALKKYRAIFKDGTHTDFGAAGMMDYTLYYKKDPELAERRKALYRERHQKDLTINDPRRAGYLSFYLLWNKPTVAQSLMDYKAKFGDL